MEIDANKVLLPDIIVNVQYTNSLYNYGQ